MAPGGAESDPTPRAPRSRRSERVRLPGARTSTPTSTRSSIRPVGVAAGGAVFGAVLGLEVATLTGAPVVVAVLTVVAGMLAGQALGHRVGAMPSEDHRNRAVIGASLLLIIGLGTVGTSARLAVGGRSVPVVWLPDAVTIVALVAAALVLVRRLRLPTADLVGSAMAFVALPVAVLLAGARLPGGGARITPGAGRTLTVGSRLLDGGATWADVRSVGGLLAALRPVPGLAWISDSAWGARAGWALWLAPLTWLLLAAVVGRLTRFRIPVVGLLVVMIAAGGAVAGGSFAPASLVMAPAWLVLAAVAGLGHGGRLRAGVLIATVVVAVLVSPATIPYGIAAGLIAVGGRLAPVARRAPGISMPAGSAQATLLVGLLLQAIAVLVGWTSAANWWPQLVILGFLALDRTIGVIDAASAFGTISAAPGASSRSLAVRFVLPVAVLLVALLGEGIVRLADDGDRPGLRLGRSLQATSERGGSGRLRYDGPAALGLTPRAIFVLGRVLDATRADRGLFDASRGGALHYFAMGQRPVVTPLDLAAVGSSSGERDLVARLRSVSRGAGPAVVIWRTAGAGTDRIDGLPNPVARPIVASWIIAHYVPYASVEGTQVWVRRSDARRLPDPRSLGADAGAPVLDAYACDWRSAPAAPTPASGKRPRDLPVVEVSAVRISGRASRAGVAATTVTAVLGDTELGTTDVHLPGGGSGSSIADGFSFLVDGPGLTASTPGLRVVATGPDGSSWQLGLRGAPPDAAGPGFAGAAVVGSGFYAAEPVVGSDVRVWRIDRTAADRSRGRLEVGTSGGAATVELGADPGIPNGAIRFRTTGGGTDVRPARAVVRVGACTQWAFGPDRQYLVVTGRSVVRSVRVT